ncbi:hypothetical protein DL766_004673 [Monosporascus sp. MC13-8B]|uniref:Cytochrome P450 n=1 Tax=Monosporascus cannonballus TaxID=155416 RepID=A0ABY0HJF0_9PEZI|nr:hypothetical protein DL762_000317 [Monosporascus cannonballus]RYP30869.1 hypothetical protein DL766_004673 [Monosporascus sp. MC13-8B]
MELIDLLPAAQPLHVAGIAFISALLVILYRGLSNPVAKVPGPWYTVWTEAAFKYHSIKGPIVRIAPDKVFVADPAGVRQIHSIKGEYPKSSWYASPFFENVFSTTSVALHRRYRKLLSGPMSETSLKAMLPQIDSKVRLAVQRMGEEMYTRGAADISKWWMFMTTDVIGELSFGESFRMLEYGEYIRDLESTGRYIALSTVFPILNVILPFIPVPQISSAFTARGRLRPYAIQSLQRHQDLVEKETADAKPTLFSKMYKAGEDESLTTDEIILHAQLYIAAGSDTTAATLTYLVWSVCRDANVKRQLVEELKTLSDDFTDGDLKGLPYLNQVIEEALRLWAAVPTGLPRVVPEGGATFGKHWLPSGAVVLTQAYSLHRNAHAFPQPETFDPSRWEKPTVAMKDCFMPFGGGSRVCLGLHLAYIELRLATARFFRTFPNATVSSIEGMSDEDMKQDLYFIMSPKGHRCLIQAS